MLQLEILLLEMWSKNHIKEIYKYKHRIKKFRTNENENNIELFTDLSCGMLFQDVEDIANHNAIAEEYMVSVDSLLENRRKMQDTLVVTKEEE